MHDFWLLRCEGDENCALLGQYAAISSKSLPTFWDSLSVPPAKGHESMGPIGCTKTTVRNYH